MLIFQHSFIYFFATAALGLTELCQSASTGSLTTTNLALTRHIHMQGIKCLAHGHKKWYTLLEAGIKPLTF